MKYFGVIWLMIAMTIAVELCEGNICNFSLDFTTAIVECGERKFFKLRDCKKEDKFRCFAGLGEPCTKENYELSLGRLRGCAEKFECAHDLSGKAGICINKPIDNTERKMTEFNNVEKKAYKDYFYKEFKNLGNEVNYPLYDQTSY